MQITERIIATSRREALIVLANSVPKRLRKYYLLISIKVNKDWTANVTYKVTNSTEPAWPEDNKKRLDNVMYREVVMPAIENFGSDIPNVMAKQTFKVDEVERVNQIGTGFE